MTSVLFAALLAAVTLTVLCEHFDKKKTGVCKSDGVEVCEDLGHKWTPCEKDSDCTDNKPSCCIATLHGVGKLCRSLPDEGDFCGPPYFCECDRKKNLTCVKTLHSTVLDCLPPAAGICQKIVLKRGTKP